MRVEVYKLYAENNKILDSVSTPTVSYESRYFPPDGKFNSNAMDNTGLTIDNKFDSRGSEYDLGSRISNVVLDYAGPEFVADHSNYTSITTDGVATIHVKLDVTDSVGLDTEKFQIGFFHGTADERILYESAHTFTEDDVPAGELNWDNQFNDAYDGPLAPVIAESSQDFITCGDEGFLYRNGNSDKYTIDFNFNFFGDTTEGTMKLVYDDLDDGIYRTFEELNAGSLFVRVWDLAGNEYVFTGLKPLIVVPWSLENFTDMLDPLNLFFRDTYPANMLLGDNVIGQTTILVENTNRVLSRKYGLETVLRLTEDSPGYLVELSRKDEDYDTTQDVDGIDSVGYVTAIAYLYCDKFDKDTIALLRKTTLARGTLGPWVKECEDNTRKINVDPFIPEFAKDTTFAHFCKFLEKFLNTAWCPLDKDCRIGLLEKISRIGDFNDIDRAEFPVIQYWAEDRGSELAFDKAAIDAIRSMSKKYNNLDMDGYECIRYLYKNLPYINLYKGTLNCFRIVFNSLGINAELIPLWAKNDGEGNEDWQPEYYYDKDKDDVRAWNKFIDDSYYLSSHLELKVHGYLAHDLVDIASSIVKLARSILPVVRVIQYLLIEEFSQSSNFLTLGYIPNSRALADNENAIQCISFLWKCSDCEHRTVNDHEVELRIPQVSERVTTDAAPWWQGWTGSATVGPVVRNGVRISNNPTLNACKFFNMMDNTLRNNKLYMYVDYSNCPDGDVPATDWLASLKPLGKNELSVTSIKWDSGFVDVRLDSNNLAGIAQLDTADYMSVTFVFNRNTGLCYTTDLKTAIATPKTDGTLPGYKPYTWNKRVR